MWKKIALGLAGLILIVLVVAAFRPDHFEVRRSVLVRADPVRIYPYLADFHRWQAWSPWEHLDPAMKRTFEGPGEGRGAVYAWAGNDQVGQGRMEIRQADPPATDKLQARLEIQLDFMEPMASRNTTVFDLKGGSDGTDVIWTMSGPAPYVTRLMTLFVSMDRMIGKDFEAGLLKLRTAVEKGGA
ncbi:MAG: hypothetical protein RL722_1546 [Pseudomonadota bacterium]|jgi:hypothetical protein